jgi:hypothetical protein
MNSTGTIELRDFIRDIPDYPKPGILFKDITPLLRNPATFRLAIERMADHHRDLSIDVVVAAEARGFIFAHRGHWGWICRLQPGASYLRHSHSYELIRNRHVGNASMASSGSAGPDR